jgi:hypothetical protein
VGVTNLPRYQQAVTYDIVRVIKNLQLAVRELQVNQPALVKQSINQITAALNTNPYFWGGDPTGWNCINGVWSTVSDPPAGAPYPYAAMYTNNGVTAGNLEETGAPFPVTPQQQYQVTAWVYSTVASVWFGFGWRDSTNTYLSTNISTLTVTPNTWTQLSMSATAPTGAAFGYPRVGTPNADASTTWAQAITVMLAPAPATVPGAWQDMRPLSNSFLGTVSGFYPPQYRLDGRGYVEVAGWVRTPPTTGSYNSVTFFTMPAAFRPSVGAHSWLVTDVADGVATPKVSVGTNGAMFMNYLPASLAQTTLSIAGRYPLDSSGMILS